MEIVPLKSWKHEFARSTEADRYREILRRANEEAKKKEKEEERREKDADYLAEMVAMATQTELADFNITLDHYDAATYDAMIENGRLLDIVRREREVMFSNAQELPDGRRVFETRDGLRVFDENGTELDRSVVTPEEIDDWRPKWEQVLENKDAERQLLEDRAAIATYQTSIDEAREQVKDGKISEQDLKALEQKLADDMPDSVREQLSPEYRPQQALVAQPEIKPEQQPQFRPVINFDGPGA